MCGCYTQWGDDICGELVEFGSSDASRFDAVEGRCIDLRNDGVGFGCRSGRAEPEPLELLYRLVDSFLKRGASERGPLAEVGFEFPEVFHDVDALPNAFP